MSGIYKSRLFNFLNRQKIRFSNQFGIALRNFQLAAETGVNILLYPVYLITRTGMSKRQQLESDSRPSKTQVKRNSGIPMLGDDLWADNEEDNLVSKTDRANAVLASTKADRMSSRLSQQGQDDSRNSPATAPIRFFRKMWNWAKTTPVATKLNLFGRANIVAANPTISSPTSTSDNSLSLLLSSSLSSEKESSAIQELIHRAIAYFFGNKRKSISGETKEALPSSQSPETAIIQSRPVNLSVIASPETTESKLTFFSKVNIWLEKIKSTLNDSSRSDIESSEPDSFAVQVLIRRAIAHFFGNKQKSISGKTQGVISSSPGLKRNYSVALPFSTFSLASESNTLSVSLPFTSWNLRLPSSLQKNLLLSDDSVNNLPIIDRKLMGAATVSLNICSESTLSINQTPQENLANIPLEFSSDFWEAEVISVGYAKSILEKILEFLDKITWWLEKQFVKLWQFVKKILSNN
ncbi:hypothetical protein Xen7305DRAFT_00010850 [Xenococcus sp. PCC 7305]|uniref:hypothetical protein n=1 Tax=Xenococcus sp. PCC 7305 TaxID=102125 RepID=UPI0002AC2090|nr:hypothetical protein [Xenococcus sp. PCC 7305]ELS01382.1 hypothetical protein Xen7305DRAFT_00010850 [Xenococcus sp. PCC 7305]